MDKGPVVLVILDGFGYSVEKKYNAVHHAYTPHLNAWFKKFPHTFLAASGMAVGLPEGAIGNSEVGHRTLGAGRVILEPVSVINNMIADKSFFSNQRLLEALDRVKKSGRTLHIMGLLSDALVHSTTTQLDAYLQAAHQQGIKKIVVHPFLDGRDVPPQSAIEYLEKLEATLLKTGGVIGTMHGRFYAMDRDNNWERTEKSYRVLVTSATKKQSWRQIIYENYKNGVKDEFIEPASLEPGCPIEAGDSVLFINFRPDRARQLTQCFVNKDFKAFVRSYIPLEQFVTPVSYSDSIETTVLFPLPPIQHCLNEILSAHNKTIFSIAETEKFAHVSYFFNANRQEPWPTETRVLIPSVPRHDYKELPQMSAPSITQTVIESLHTNPRDFYVINYANADMVAHSGNFEATVKAIECLDDQLNQLYDVVIDKLNGTLLITADHGNAEEMFDEKTAQPKTAHTANRVIFLMIQKSADRSARLPLNQLADVAPFILRLMGLPIPYEMKQFSNFKEGECMNNTRHMWALTILRVTLGSIFFAHGAQKVFGWFGGPGLKGFVAWTSTMHVPEFFGYLAAFAEFIGGCMLLVGFGAEIGAVLTIPVMIGAVLLVHLKGGYFGQNGGFEYPLNLIFLAIATIVGGPGYYALWNPFNDFKHK